MNTTEAKGTWNAKKGQLKQRIAILTDDDKMLLSGKKIELIGKLQTKLGQTKEDLHKFISGL